MVIEKTSHCKVNLLLNILGRRPDGYHELESLFYPVYLLPHEADFIKIELSHNAISLTCSNPHLPADSRNLVYRAAEAFLKTTRAHHGVKIYLEKRLPLSSGIGAGSANAANTLLALNELCGYPLDTRQLSALASTLGADVPFFIYSQPAIATGKGEILRPVGTLASLRDTWILLIYPGFGVSTAWAYRELAKYPKLLNGLPGRAENLAGLLNQKSLAEAASEFYNAFETPVFKKYPLIALLKKFCLDHGAIVSIMSGSGSTVFAILNSYDASEYLKNMLIQKFGKTIWVAASKL